MQKQIQGSFPFDKLRVRMKTFIATAVTLKALSGICGDDGGF
jgi:hypothetical protein